MTEASYNNNHYQDKIIRCVDCGKDFTFSAGEAAFFSSKQPPLAEPKRCKACRDYRRQTIHPPVDYDKTIAQAKSLFPNDYHQGVGQ